MTNKDIHDGCLGIIKTAFIVLIIFLILKYCKKETPTSPSLEMKRVFIFTEKESML